MIVEVVLIKAPDETLEPEVVEGVLIMNQGTDASLADVAGAPAATGDTGALAAQSSEEARLRAENARLRAEMEQLRRAVTGAPIAATRDDATTDAADEAATAGAAPAGYAFVARFLSRLDRSHLFEKFLEALVDDQVLLKLDEVDLDDMAIPSDSDAARAILGGIRDAEFIAGLRV